jgi:hypothetical protein
MSVEGGLGPGPGSAWSGEEGARRLFAALRGACAEAEGLPARLAAGLWTTFEILGEEPELAHRLTVEPYLQDGGGDDALDAHQKWIRRFGGLLRDAAAEDPRATQVSSFLAPFLIGGVRFQIARLVMAGEASDLLRLLPGTLEALLAYYFEPGEPRRLAHIALAGRD